MEHIHLEMWMQEYYRSILYPHKLKNTKQAKVREIRPTKMTKHKSLKRAA